MSRSPRTMPTARLNADAAGRRSSSFVLRLTQSIVLVDYCAVGAMRTVLPYYAKELGAAGRHIGGLETVYGLGQVRMRDAACLCVPVL